jgi:hypothetical protein
VDSGEQDVIPLPAISSLVFVFNTDDVENFKVRFFFGMENVFCSSRNITFNSHQSVTHIIYDCITSISMELQIVMSKKRKGLHLLRHVW